jgi:RNA polymerase sigma-70 factor, ECF subfamily
MPDADAGRFEAATSPYRKELLAHCYRMTGSIQEAEDIVQDTYVRAWRAFGRFEGRSSVRTWLYRIATNACLTALQRRSLRPLPSGLGPPSADAWRRPGQSRRECAGSSRSPFAVVVLATTETHLKRISLFTDPALFSRFDLRAVLPSR